MRRVKTEVAIIGSGAGAMLAANRLIGQGASVVLINPMPEFLVDDLRPRNGMGLWNAAYRASAARAGAGADSPLYYKGRDENISLPSLYEELVARVREVFPATVEQSGLSRGEHLSVLSSTLIHRSVTEELEKEFFKLERKPWSSGHFRLVNPEHVLVRARRLGVDLENVAQVEGGVIRSHSLWWDAAKMGSYLSQFIHTKFGIQSSSRESDLRAQQCFTDASIEGRYGRRLVILSRDEEEVSIEAERGIYVFLTGDLLPKLKSIVASCDEPWIQGVRKRRRERHFVWFQRPRALQPPSGVDGEDEKVWFELGHTRYRWSRAGGLATWKSEKGPDGLERVVDEGLRLHSLPKPTTRFVRAARAFWMEWDWKAPMWRETSHGMYWATAFEGDLWGMMELLWNLPRH